jgi:site-specific recombinase XerD
VLRALKQHRHEQDRFRQKLGTDYRSDLDLIFANPNGTPLKPDTLSASISRLCRRLGLPKGVSLHTLRHSHGSVLLADGVDLATVSERLGHSSVRVTADIYSHALRGRDQEAALHFHAAHVTFRGPPEGVLIHLRSDEVALTKISLGSRSSWPCRRALARAPI